MIINFNLPNAPFDFNRNNIIILPQINNKEKLKFCINYILNQLFIKYPDRCFVLFFHYEVPYFHNEPSPESTPEYQVLLLNFNSLSQVPCPKNVCPLFIIKVNYKNCNISKLTDKLLFKIYKLFKQKNIGPIYHMKLMINVKKN